MAAIPLPGDLRDDVIALRAFSSRDAAAVVFACQDPLIDRFTTFPPSRDEADAETWILGQTEQRRSGQALDLAVVSRVSGSFLGAVGLGEVSDEHRRGTVGYWLAPDARDAGHAARAVRLLTDWALGPPLKLVRIELHTDIQNVASQRTAERAGFTREGVLRSYLEAKGRRWDVAIYARLPPD